AGSSCGSSWLAAAPKAIPRPTTSTSTRTSAANQVSAGIVDKARGGGMQEGTSSPLLFREDASAMHQPALDDVRATQPVRRLLVLPPGSVPLFAALGLAGGTLAQALARRTEAERVPLAVSDAWHTLGPAAVLLAAGPADGATELAVFLAAFFAGCLVDLVSAT